MGYPIVIMVICYQTPHWNPHEISLPVIRGHALSDNWAGDGREQVRQRTRSSGLSKRALSDDSQR
ncbi:hypothetical protein BN873_p10055 [Candidatus Competibacter denitrificans Run_A_D11]|uniref:Uncharacterized protein n=1 Tax=Candidatus Competibacter denitrificans Run_A_D11 TaxID=1400863 RepID=W6M9D8_9GAMM|nr:hypothetical protein BN873_p10055 [Candidatus Competibacter denitrificans Run_A_D11]